jgi:Xaa-Pro dipeptidase
MAVHFSVEELARRRARVCAEIGSRGLDGMLLFRQESMYYLTGYDTFGYVFFQCLYLGVDGAMTLLTRAPDLRQARHTSVIEDIRIWADGPDAEPAKQLRDILDGHGCRGGRLGVEWDAYGLTAANGRRLEAVLIGHYRLIDASDLVSRLRVVKSAAEIDYVRRAAELADDAYDAAVMETAEGADESDILASMQGAVFRGGGDYPANEFIIGSGPGALMCRYFSGRRQLTSQDQLTLEWAGAYRHYHAAMMRTFVIGSASDLQLAYFDATADALAAVKQAIRPGNTYGDAFDAHARVLDAHDLGAHRLNACGYSLGAVFAPNWMDWPMLYADNPVPFEAGMTVFCHMIVLDSDTGVAMCLGETVLVTDDGHERLSRAPLELVVR